MRYLLITLLLLAGCSNHRLVLVYEGGEAAINGGADIVIETKRGDKNG